MSINISKIFPATFRNDDMKDQDKTKEQLIDELTKMRQKITRLEALQNEHQQLESELRKVKAVFDTMIDGVTITDMEGRITDINRATTEQLGYTYEEAIGKTPDELFIVERDRAKFLFNEHPHAVSARPISASEYIVKHKNGSEFTISVNISSLRDPDGTPIGVVAVHRDITEQKDAQEKLKNAKDELERRVKERTSELVIANKQLREEINERKRTGKAFHKSEEKFRLTFENAKDAIFWAEIETGRIIQCNKAAETLLERKREEVIGISQTAIHPPQKREFYSDIFKKHIEKRGAIDEEAEIITKTGKIKTVQISASIIDIRGKSIMQGIFQDITEKRRMEEEVMNAHKLESVGILAGGIAHDFNNILLSILGNVSLAKTQANDKDSVLKRLVKVEKAVMRAKDLTRQFLTFSKGGMPIRKTVSVKETIQEYAAFALMGSNVECDFSIPSDLWPVEVDEGQFSQVLNNLIINADQAMPEGGVVKVCAENTTVVDGGILPLKEGRYIKISIEDQGAGIPEEQLSKIFDPYFTTKERGSGLGLAVTYSIIKAHDGHIKVESRLGIGTTFYIHLPASHGEIHTIKGKDRKPLFGKGRILLMDDEEVVRDVAGEMLEYIGYEVDFAEDGTKAIELYKLAKESDRPFNVVIMDLTVPGGMGGKKTIRKLLEIDPEVKAIVSSGYSNDSVMTNFRQCGFKSFITKPYKIEELSEKLHTVITGIDI